MIQKISVGERPIGSDYLFVGDDGMLFDMMDGGGTLIVRMCRPSQHEINDFKTRLHLRFRVVDGIIFILIQIGDDWSDAPYYRKFSSGLTHLPSVPDGAGLSTHAIMSDGNTGTVVAQKLISFSTNGSRALIKAISEQPEIPDYYDRVTKAMYMYSTADLVMGSISLF